MASPRRCVLLFSRAPLAEAQAKRLPFAGELFRLVQRRLHEAAAALGADLVCVAAAPEVPRRSESGSGIWQRGHGFGERLRNAFEDVRALGYAQIVIVPGDVPGLGQAQLQMAFRLLDEHRRLVLGPSPDGGVYLIGCPVGEEGVLAGVRWQTSSVLADLLDQVPEADQLAPLADLDRTTDLKRLEADATLPPDVRALLHALRRGSSARRGPVDVRPRETFWFSPDAPRGPPTRPLQDTRDGAV